MCPDIRWFPQIRNDSIIASAEVFHHFRIFSDHVISDVEHLPEPFVLQRFFSIKNFPEDGGLAPWGIFGVHQDYVEVVLVHPELERECPPLLRIASLAPLAQA